MLDQDQEKAVSHGKGPMIVVAGPGSGKTRVLTERARRLLSVTAPEKICIITFARKAADEMKERFAQLTDEETAEKVCFGTFHSVFFRWLRQWGLLQQGTGILDEEEKEQWLNRMGRERELPAHSLCRWDGENALRKAYFAYKKQEGKIDFDDILSMMDKAIEYYAPYEEFEYFMVDEFQDIDERQYRILKKIVCPAGKESSANLMIVGDDDQSIYAFRGSRPDLFLQFETDFPGSRRVDLSINYRSDPSIVAISNRLIEHNQVRFPKHIRAGKKQGIGMALHLKCFYDDQEEARGMAEIIRRRYLLSMINGHHLAILCRTSEEGGRMSIAMEEAGVPFDGREEWAEREERHAVILQRDLKKLNLFVDHPADRQIYGELYEMFPDLLKAGYVRRLSKEENILDGLLRQDRLSAVQRGKIKQLRHVCEKKVGWHDLLLRTDYLAHAGRRLEERNGTKLDLFFQWLEWIRPASRRVQILTMHGAKGLEFDEVFIVSCCDGLMPRKEALEETKEIGLEEERRLMYVAMTRAKKRLTMSYFNGLGTKPSQFVHEALGD